MCHFQLLWPAPTGVRCRACTQIEKMELGDMFNDSAPVAPWLVSKMCLQFTWFKALLHSCSVYKYICVTVGVCEKMFGK